MLTKANQIAGHEWPFPFFFTRIQKLCEKNNYDSEIFCGIKERSFKGFESNNAFKIWDGTYQNSLESSSELIKTLLKSREISLIIYPNLIKSEITTQISVLKNNS